MEQDHNISNQNLLYWRQIVRLTCEQRGGEEKCIMGTHVLGLPSEEKGFRRTRDVWFMLADINWRTTQQDALCSVAFLSKFHLGNFQFQLHFFVQTHLCAHAHMCLLAQRPMDSRALVWVVHCKLQAAKRAPDSKLENELNTSQKG